MRGPVEAVAFTLATAWLLVYGAMEAASRPAVRVTASPQVAQVPVTVRVIGRVLDPGQQLHCPAFSWDFGDGCTSSSTPDCDPYQAPDDRPRLWAGGPLSPKAHTYRRPGEYVIALTVTAGDRQMRDTVRVRVIGPGLLDGGSR